MHTYAPESQGVATITQVKLSSPPNGFITKYNLLAFTKQNSVYSLR